MTCGKEFRYRHTWDFLRRNGLEMSDRVKQMLTERDRELEDFISNEPCSGMIWFEADGTWDDTTGALVLTGVAREDGVTVDVSTGGADPDLYGWWQTTVYWGLAPVPDATADLEVTVTSTAMLAPNLWDKPPYISLSSADGQVTGTLAYGEGSVMDAFVPAEWATGTFDIGKVVAHYIGPADPPGGGG